MQTSSNNLLNKGYKTKKVLKNKLIDKKLEKIKNKNL